MIVIGEVALGLELSWHDVQQGLTAGIALANAGEDRTLARAWVEGSWWRLLVEGGRDLPDKALTRLHDLCQTAASL